MNERQAPARKRYAPSERRRMILDGAISFFAEYGLDGSTHLLAKHLGVTQPLIYQYFPSKEDLIDAVYEEVFRGRWSSRWDTLLADRARPLEERLNAFFVQTALSRMHRNGCASISFRVCATLSSTSATIRS
ncbi:TetR/AcrR family transcriptional regulator [Mesorhizobium sp. J428]|uniref:TetR/AcrR family transcriptional regulator n=1 Tax=Mesorhizobium sp. J428 TaxID=2898440 RepID=UPI0021511078|nr:TetR/AcrR family transcriptional regulator [Mesorhizobium sp. J428]MCR5857511.1 TetR/AcrR family transcriptional regulator [Mesorhizobium sp. J428]